MTELLTAAQMRAIEQAAIESGVVTGLELMERAGRGVVEAIFEEWPDLAKTSQRAVVLCGPGNNGGDGFVVARLLKEWGWEVEVFLYGDPERLPPDARVNYERWSALGATGDHIALIERYGWDAEHALCFQGNEVMFVDAAFGTGLTRPLEADLLNFLADVRNSSLGKVVSVDIPSGHCSDSGRFLVPAVSESGDDFIGWSARPVDLNVTFHRAKSGLLLGDGECACASLRIVDIGLDRFHWNLKWASMGTTGILKPRLRWVGMAGPVDPSIPFRADFPVQKSPYGHKYSHGHALILSGGPGKGGAARLAARGALRIGSGLVTVGCPPAALQENAARLDAIMLKPVHDADALTRILEDTRINALGLGPALGTGERAAALVATALRAKRLTVLDADALTLIAGDEPLFAAVHEDCVLTPHAGEFARLFPDIAEKLAAPATKGPAYSKVDATREAAARAGCVVLFKGPDTVIADPSGRCAINSAHYDRAAPWLATAGSGDVLAGFITGLLARGFAPMQAAETAAWLHVECALSFGPGLIAEDLPEELSKVFRALGL